MKEFRDEDLSKFKTLVRIMNYLRSPDGCPWDLEQTSESLRPYVLEEAYEVVEAIDSGKMDDLCEELGDLLLQIVFHAQIASESGDFDVSGVINAIVTKLIRRHPHVFGDVKASTPSDVLKNWHQIKRGEKSGSASKSIFDGVPELMPALLKALAYSRRAAQVGFDWDKPINVIKKLEEEVEELAESLRKADSKNIEEEIGDIFFVMANVARHLNVNPELALEKANRKFKRRFNYIEKKLEQIKSSPQQASMSEMDKLWDESKKLEDLPE